MNKVFISLLVVFIGFGCKSDPKISDETTNQPENASQNTGEQISPSQEAIANQDLKKDLPQRMQNVVDWTWWFEAYVSDRTGFGQTQKGKWFKLDPAGKFEYGMYQDLSGTGKWRYDVAKEALFLTYDKDGEVQEWKTMMSNTNDIMIWMAPGTGPLRGDQAKLVRYLQRPEVGQVGK